MRYLSYCVNEACANMLEARGLSFVALMTTALSMLCVGLFFLLYVNIHAVLQSFEDEINMIIYVHEGRTAEQTSTLERLIQSYPEVDTVDFTSSQEAIATYLERYPSEAAAVSALGEGALPASFVVSFASGSRTVAGVESFATKIEALSGVAEIQYGQDWIRTFWWGNHVLVWIGSIVGVTLAATSIAIVANTIRLTLFRRRQDIHILRLIGASESFIRGPFFVEGAVLGLLGAGMSVLFLKAIYESFTYSVRDAWIAEYTMAFLALPTLCLFLVGGTILGFVGGVFSVVSDRRTQS